MPLIGPANKGGRKGRTAEQIANTDKKIIDLARRGKTDGEIGEMLGLSTSQVQRDRSRIFRRHKRDLTCKLNEYQWDVELRLKEIQAEAWNEFEQSKLEQRVLTHKNEDGTRSQEIVEVRVPGSNEHLRTILATISEEIDLYGLRAPKQRHPEEVERAGKNDEFIDEIIPFLKKAREQLTGSQPVPPASFAPLPAPTVLVTSPNPIQPADPLEALLTPSDEDSDTLKDLLNKRGKSISSEGDSEENSNTDNTAD